MSVFMRLDKFRDGDSPDAIFLHLHDNFSGSTFTLEARVQKNMAEKKKPKTNKKRKADAKPRVPHCAFSCKKKKKKV